jgi:hypothetical protein
MAYKMMRGPDQYDICLLNELVFQYFRRDKPLYDMVAVKDSALKTDRNHMTVTNYMN